MIYGAIMQLLRNLINETKKKSVQHKIQEISPYFISVISGELKVGTKTDGGLAWKYINKINKFMGYSLVWAMLSFDHTSHIIPGRGFEEVD